MQRCNRWCRERVARAALHLFPPPLNLASSSPILSLFRPPSPFSLHSLVFTCFICNVSKTVDSSRGVLRYVSSKRWEGGKKRKERGKEKRRREIKMQANRRYLVPRASLYRVCRFAVARATRFYKNIISFVPALLALFPSPQPFPSCRHVLFYSMPFHRFRAISFRGDLRPSVSEFAAMYRTRVYRCYLFL